MARSRQASLQAQNRQTASFVFPVLPPEQPDLPPLTKIIGCIFGVDMLAKPPSPKITPFREFIHLVKSLWICLPLDYQLAFQLGKTPHAESQAVADLAQWWEIFTDYGDASFNEEAFVGLIEFVAGGMLEYERACKNSQLMKSMQQYTNGLQWQLGQRTICDLTFDFNGSRRWWHILSTQGARAASPTWRRMMVVLGPRRTVPTCCARR
ncbi:hypothetical protein BJ508DRAFT_315902 [Ascobolus immersus RN42]|uniref:Uncharacterized protein n=1 Tax=Ascobolus immersus RN42 TaxID=1160509 RepID=A0A3N4HFB8_ASCIM|nr:hypothetical protein BJ508DRAFT_315902 [Ascobolus immersus RN42]